jgi:hypothetical protein
VKRDNFPALVDFRCALKAIGEMCIDFAYAVGAVCLAALAGGFIAGLGYAFFIR